MTAKELKVFCTSTPRQSGVSNGRMRARVLHAIQWKQGTLHYYIPLAFCETTVTMAAEKQTLLAICPLFAPEGPGTGPK